MPQLDLEPFPHASTFRRIAAAAWAAPNDPTIYGILTLRAEPLLAHLAAHRAATGQRLTVTHAVARAAAIALSHHRDLNAVVRFGSLHLRRDIDIFLQVALPAEGPDGAVDLSGVMLRRADQLSLAEVGARVAEGAQKARAGEDPELARGRRTAALPGWLLRLLFPVVRFLQTSLNLDLRPLGLPRDPFGSLQITSLGMMGIRMGFAPFFPMATSPIILMVGAVEDAPVVEGGQVVVGKVLTICASADHRIVDGTHCARFAQTLKGLLEAPARLDSAVAPVAPGQDPR